MLHAPWAKALAACVFLIGLWLLQRFPEALEFRRQLILNGQLWRVLTGHWVHANTVHFVLNISAALLLYVVFFRSIKVQEWMASGVVFSALISVCLLLFMPELDWYNGLSGLLHAWVVYGSIRKIQAGHTIYWLAVVLVWLKVLFEMAGVGGWFGSVLHGVNIIHEAHMMGAVIGAVTGLLMYFWGKIRYKNRH